MVWPGWVALAFTVLRTLRGLTLDTDGITWHAKEIFVPWANVSAVRIGSDLRRPDTRTDTDLKLVVDVLYLDLVVADLRNHRRRTVINNETRFGGPIALPVAKLNVLAEEIIAVAERLKADAGSASTSAPDRDKAWSRRERAVMVMRTIDTLGGMGLMIGLMFILFR
jgi:hypothetical protein